MTRFLLDTNIISDVTKAVPSPLLTGWMAEQLDAGLFISSLSLAEIRRGVLENPTGKSADNLKNSFRDRRVLKRYFEDACCVSTKRPHSSGLVLWRKALPYEGRGALSTW